MAYEAIKHWCNEFPQMAECNVMIWLPPGCVMWRLVLDNNFSTIFYCPYCGINLKTLE